MDNKKNEYEKNRTKKSLLGAITTTQETKGDVKNSLIEMGKDLIVGVIGGGIVGAAIGKASLLVGAAVTTVGHYTKSRLATIFGVGMMASNGFQPKQESVNGTSANGLEGAKERVLNFKDSFSQKLFLDKVMKKKKEGDTTSTSTSTNGVGEVQYFVHPEEQPKQLEGEQVDLTPLEQLEQKVAESAQAFQQKQASKTAEGVGELGELDPGELNY